MSQIKVKNFGPIKEGFLENDGFIDIRKVTVFIGNQATGKSSIAKLISTLSWLEKSLYRGDFKESEVIRYNRFVKKHCAYQGLKNYFLPETEIEFRGKVFSFHFYEGKLEIHKTGTNDYLLPKIMYVPAERNFLSVVSQPEKLKGLPLPLYTFLEEYEKALQDTQGQIVLPVNEMKFEFQKQNKIAYIVGNDYKIRLSEASSGLQSLLPLFLVSQYLVNSLNKKRDHSKKEISREEQKRMKQEIERILANNKLSEEVKTTALEVLSAMYQNACFLNIVEEIEQNLFPKSQKDLLFKLLEFTNSKKGNQLILTTHSPYIINYLTLAIKGKAVFQKIKKTAKEEELKSELEKIIPETSCINAQDAIVYELTETGRIKRLPTYQGLPSDENYLNNSLAAFNDSFVQLLEVEEKCL